VRKLKTITIVTPSNIEIEYKLAGVGSRLVAYIIDFLLQIILGILVFVLIWYVDTRIIGVNRPTMWGSVPMSGTAEAIALIAFFVIHVGYFIVSELLMNGQTIGKRIFGLRTIRDNGQPIEIKNTLIRGLLRSSLDMMYIGLFFIIFSKKCKRLGDIAAGTIVVNEYYSRFYSPVLTSTLHAEWPEFLPPPTEMTATERQTVEMWMRRKDYLPHRGRELAMRLKNYHESKNPQYYSKED